MILLKRSVVAMKDYGGRFKRYVMSFSFKERRARELTKYRKRVFELEKMDSDAIEIVETVRNKRS